MSTSTLDPDNSFEPDRKIGKGHGTDALGPSDSSDSGSDVANLAESESDSDTQGTGERASVDPEEDDSGRDIGFDRIDHVTDEPEDISKKGARDGDQT